MRTLLLCSHMSRLLALPSRCRAAAVPDVQGAGDRQVAEGRLRRARRRPQRRRQARRRRRRLRPRDLVRQRRRLEAPHDHRQRQGRREAGQRLPRRRTTSTATASSTSPSAPTGSSTTPPAAGRCSGCGRGRRSTSGPFTRSPTRSRRCTASTSPTSTATASPSCSSAPSAASAARCARTTWTSRCGCSRTRSRRTRRRSGTSRACSTSRCTTAQLRRARTSRRHVEPDPHRQRRGRRPAEWTGDGGRWTWTHIGAGNQDNPKGPRGSSEVKAGVRGQPACVPRRDRAAARAPGGGVPFRSVAQVTDDRASPCPARRRGRRITWRFVR